MIGGNREKKLDGDTVRERERERHVIFLNVSAANHLSRQKHCQVLLCVLPVCLVCHPVILFDSSLTIKTNESREAEGERHGRQSCNETHLGRDFPAVAAILLISVLCRGCLFGLGSLCLYITTKDETLEP